MSAEWTKDTAFIYVSGCDDRTRASVQVTEAEYAFLALLANGITEHGGGCRPTMEVSRQRLYCCCCVDEPHDEDCYPPIERT